MKTQKSTSLENISTAVKLPTQTSDVGMSFLTCDDFLVVVGTNDASRLLAKKRCEAGGHLLLLLASQNKNPTLDVPVFTRRPSSVQLTESTELLNCEEPHSLKGRTKSPHLPSDFLWKPPPVVKSSTKVYDHRLKFAT